MARALYNRISREELINRAQEDNTPRTTLSFYRYVRIDDPQAYRDDLYRRLDELGVYGRIYVATEGINAQINVPTPQFEKFTELVAADPHLGADMRLNVAVDKEAYSFYKLVIKVRPKILADGLDDNSIDFSNAGTHLSARDFNKLTDEERCVIIDMRNHYESEVGHFKGAICPDVETFRSSLPIISDMLREHEDKHIIMYCTGGIRCEKASSYFKQQGYEKVYQLDGGIIEYTRQAEAEGLENKFIGKNFVFDERLGERISSEVIAHCHQCGAACDAHTNCANDACHLLFIQCPSCQEKYDGCCSSKCSEFHQLSTEEQAKQKAEGIEFNGSRFGKGRYKAHSKGACLEMS